MSNSWWIKDQRSPEAWSFFPGRRGRPRCPTAFYHIRRVETDGRGRDAAVSANRKGVVVPPATGIGKDPGEQELFHQGSQRQTQWRSWNTSPDGWTPAGKRQVFCPDTRVSQRNEPRRGDGRDSSTNSLAFYGRHSRLQRNLARAVEAQKVLSWVKHAGARREGLRGVHALRKIPVGGPAPVRCTISVSRCRTWRRSAAISCDRGKYPEGQQNRRRPMKEGRERKATDQLLRYRRHARSRSWSRTRLNGKTRGPPSAATSSHRRAENPPRMAVVAPVVDPGEVARRVSGGRGW